jgi:hypothetical protein
MQRKKNAKQRLQQPKRRRLLLKRAALKMLKSPQSHYRHPQMNTKLIS